MTKKKIKKLLESLCNGVYEREEVIRLSLLSSIAGDSIFLLGPPGVAKSLVARKLKHAFKNAKSFEYLMSRFSTPDEVFGPISIQKLKIEDKYERITVNYLPDCEIVFLDEIWKASPPIQNSLLTAINEKVFRNGNQEIKIKLRGLISASNELPAENEGLEALWDRFIIRLYLGGIQDESKFNQMVTDSSDLYDDNVPEECKISDDEYKSWASEIDKIEVPDEVLDIVSLIRKKITLRNQSDNETKPIYISDRRWKKILKLMKTSAFLNDRQSVDIMDCFIISHCIWSNEDEIEEVHNIVAETIRKNGYKIGLDTNSINAELNSLKHEINTDIEALKEEIEVQYKEPVLHQQEYLKIEGLTTSDNYYGRNSEAYLQRSDFDLLDRDYINIQLYYLYNGLDMRESQTIEIRKTSDIEIELKDSSKHRIEAEEKTKKETLKRKLSETQKGIWNQRIGELYNYCDELLLKIAEYKRKDLEHATSNLFVDQVFSKIAFANLDKTSNDVSKLRIELEKTRDSYESYKSDE